MLPLPDIFNYTFSFTLRDDEVLLKSIGNTGNVLLMTVNGLQAIQFFISRVNGGGVGTASYSWWKFLVWGIVSNFSRYPRADYLKVNWSARLFKNLVLRVTDNNVRGSFTNQPISVFRLVSIPRVTRNFPTIYRKLPSYDHKMENRFR